MQEIFALVSDFLMNTSHDMTSFVPVVAPFNAARTPTISACKPMERMLKVSRIGNLLSSRKRCKMLQPKINPDRSGFRYGCFGGKFQPVFTQHRCEQLSSGRARNADGLNIAINRTTDNCFYLANPWDLNKSIANLPALWNMKTLPRIFTFKLGEALLLTEEMGVSRFKIG